MKCKYCDGTGEHINDANRMTTCEFCGGTGEVEVVGDSVTDVFDKCGGTGFCEMRMGDGCTLGSPCPHQKPQTNEEWFCSLSTEEKAIFITMFALRRKFVNKGAFYESVKNSLINASELPKMPINLRRSVEEWLKEKYE